MVFEEISKRRVAGLASIILGISLITLAGWRQGSKIDWWAGYFTKRIEAISSLEEQPKSLEELEQENDYLKKSAYLGAGGVALLLSGIALAGTGERFLGPGKETDYGRSLSTYRRRVYRI
jgi:membrane protein YqaA with SNARE-associated domain